MTKPQLPILPRKSKPAPTRSGITLLSPRELEKMRRVGRLAAQLLDFLEPLVQPGVSTQTLNDEAERWTRSRGAISAPLNYQPPEHTPFPRSICTSVNEVVCHGIPNSQHILQAGDIINIDVTPIFDGFHGDSSRTFYVGTPDPSARKLVETTREAMMLGIAQVKPGAKMGDIGAAIQEYAESRGFSVVRELVGHGIGREFHCPPEVPHYGERGKGLKLRPGMVFTIEPMLNQGTREIEMMGDGWTVLTRDRALSAQFEHTVAVVEGGVEILTQSASQLQV